MKNLEQELKLSLDKREYGILREVANAEPILQVNYYFTSSLMQKDEMVRIRFRRGKYIMCYKKQLSARGEVQVCDERECDLDGDSAKRMIDCGITKLDMLQFLQIPMEDDLVYVGLMKTYRIRFKLNEWTLELDENEYLGKTDYELECESARFDSLEKLKSYLPYMYGIVLKPSSPKVMRFMRTLNNAE